MTVRELRDALKTMPSNAHVRFAMGYVDNMTLLKEEGNEIVPAELQDENAFVYLDVLNPITAASVELRG